MSKKTLAFGFAVGTVVGCSMALFGSGVLAAGADPALLTAAKLGITAYEDDDKVGSGGAPQKILLDNDVVRVRLVSFPAGFNRPGKLKRRYDQVLAYIDTSDYTITWNGVPGEAVPPEKQKASRLAPGSVVWHPRETVVSDSHVNSPYRVLFIEMKKE